MLEFCLQLLEGQLMGKLVGIGFFNIRYNNKNMDFPFQREVEVKNQ